jgi:hypothetical protein
MNETLNNLVGVYLLQKNASWYDKKDTSLPSPSVLDATEHSRESGDCGGRVGPLDIARVSCLKSTCLSFWLGSCDA